MTACVSVLVRAPREAVASILADELPDATVMSIDSERCLVRSSSLAALSDADLALIVRARGLPVAGWRRHDV